MAGPGREGAAGHGSAQPRPGTGAGRFGRMFPCLPRRDAGPDALEELVGALDALKDTSLESDRIPAGYTYLGQFIDHDITFDATSRLDQLNDPPALVNFRTPRLDLDSLYGSGQADQPFLYDWRGDASQRGVKLLVGRNPPDAGYAPADLPRNDQGRALTGDARNDENLIVSQLHLLFIRFHNKVVDELLAGDQRPAAEEAFGEAQRIVRWHYQWIVTHDFLTKIVDAELAASVLARAAPVTEIPVEFSAAAYRFGHSMVRNDYILNDSHVDVPTFPQDPAEPGPHLGGLRRLPEDLVIEWRRFFRTTGTRMRSMQIDTSLAGALFRLPQNGAPLAAPQLAALNLRRGRALGLPAGDAVASAMGAAALSDEQLLPRSMRLSDGAREALLRAPPLWYYVLREAEVVQKGRRLGPVGGRIVAEVLVGLLAADPDSYLRTDPSWKPEPALARDGDFTMLDLVDYTLGHP
jgi:Animal haem peroxidase